MRKRKLCIFRVTCVLISLCFLFSALCGCGDNQNQAAYKRVNDSILETEIVAANSDYELRWEKDAEAVVLASKKNDVYWSDILYQNFLDGSTSANGNSPINITVYNTDTLKTNTVRSYSELQEKGSIICKKIENGIRVSYFFDTYKIVIPVDYVLREDSLQVKVDTSKIIEDGSSYKLISISLLPFMCSIKNEAQNGYVFIPVGSGALMHSNVTVDGIKKYSGEVYGADAARQVHQSVEDETALRLPVFGVAGDERGMLGIIESGEGAATINAQAGNDSIGYSNAYPTFNVRGYDVFSSDSFAIKEDYTTRFSENISGRTFSVGYYPLYGDAANYNGMAAKYREYLISNYYLQKSDNDAVPYSVTLLGGTNIIKSFFGLPYNKLVALTTFSDALNIVKELEKDTSILPNVRMLGFGDNGVRYGKVAGGADYPSAYGNKNDISSLQQIFEKENAKLFMDSEIVYFSKSGNGFSLNSDTAKTAILKRITHYPLSPTRIPDSNNGYNVLARSSLKGAAQFSVKKAQKYGNTAISFSSLGSVAFSDYDSIEYDNKNKIEKDTITILNDVKKEGLSVAVADANWYAACAADCLFDIEITNGGYKTFDQTVPFYQMIFHSYKPMYTNGINLSESIDNSVTEAIAFGMGIGFTFNNNYVDESIDLDEFPFYGSIYEDSRELVHKYVVENKYAELYCKVADSVFEEYNLLENGVSVSAYSNGTKVYTNHTAEKAHCSAGMIEAYSFIVE